MTRSRSAEKLFDGLGILPGQGGIEAARDADLGEGIHLVLHQRDEGETTTAQPPQQGGNLVAEAFPPPVGMSTRASPPPTT